MNEQCHRYTPYLCHTIYNGSNIDLPIVVKRGSEL